MARRVIPSGLQRWQPQTPLAVAPEFQAGLAFALLPGLGWGAPMSALVAPSAFGVFSDLARGQAYKATASATKSWNTACGSLGNEYTLLVLATYVASQALIADDSPTSNLNLQCGGATGKFVLTAYNTSGTSYAATSAAVSSAEQLTGTVIGARVSSSQSKVQLTIDGVTVTTATTGTLRSPSNPRIGGLKAGTNPNAVIALAAAWTYYMPDSELLALLANSYGLFRPRQRRLYFGAASSGFTGTIGRGSLTKTGKIPGNVIAYHLVPSSGALTKTGASPILTRKFSFAPLAGSIPKNGQQPTLTRRLFFTPGTGALVKDGLVPVLTVPRHLTPGTGSIIKIGERPGLSIPFTIGSGNLTKTGQMPTLTISGQPTIVSGTHSWFVKAIGVKTKGSVHSQVDSDSGDTP